MNLREAYRLHGEDSATGARARQLLDQQDWYGRIAEFDPGSGQALPAGFDAVLRRLANRATATDPHDRLWRLVEHSRAPIERIFNSLNENPQREQAMLPIRDVKELNATSFIALNRRPGRNVREKLAGKPYMQAVRRYQSVDLPQNRLLKEFATRLTELLETRLKYLGHEDLLLGDITRWLHSEQAHAISRWDNLAPNNTLLSHRDYRRVWDAWKWMQSLDEDIDRDFAQLSARAATVERWEAFGRAFSQGKTLFGAMPVRFDYDSFTIEPWREPVTRATTLVDRPGNRPQITTPTCIDLTYLRPRYATADANAATSLPEAFLWQRWSSEHDSVDLELFDADMALLNDDATTVSCADVLFAGGADPSLTDQAAHAFTRKLSKTFTNPVLSWLVPDFLNDFQLQVARRTINARFSKAEPLPRSIAAAFDQIDYATIDGVGFEALVVDRSGGTIYATKLIARHDSDLQDRVPETRGFYWERSPHVTLHHDASDHDALTEIPRVRDDGRWQDAAPVVGLQRVSQEALRRHPQIREFDVCITVPESPVRGGIRLHELQERAGDIPLWRDHIPELSIKVFSPDGRYEPFYLVSQDTTIRPVRAAAVPIPVDDRFTLPAGKLYYQFDLYQGRDSDALGYVARLESPAFPLAAAAICRLEMTYTYGADDPYRLLFVPIDDSFKAVQTKWQPKTEQVVTDAPAPEYPPALSWSDLRSWLDAQGNAVDLLAWLVDTLDALYARLPAPKRRITVASPWRSKTDRNGAQYWSATATADDGSPYRCDSKNFFPRLNEDPSESLPPGTPLFAILESDWARQVSLSDAISDSDRRRILSFRQRSLQNRVSAIWGDSRSLGDPDCPPEFRSKALSQLDLLSQRMPQDLYDRKMNVLLASMHKDAPPRNVEWILKQVDSKKIVEARAVGASLGFLELPWQRHVHSQLLSHPGRHSVAAFSYAIWRDRQFVETLSLADLQSMLSSVGAVLGSIGPFTQQVHDKDARRGWARSAAEPLELLLGLLRTRASSTAEVQMLLQPHQKLTASLATAVERVAEIAADSRIGIPSRVQLSHLPAKAEGDRTPDIVYALRLYLTGDVGANAIRVTGVNDGEDD